MNDEARWRGAPQSDEESTLFGCECVAFALWYVDNDGPAINVCKCGHPEVEHDGVNAACTGILERM